MPKVEAGNTLPIPVYHLFFPRFRLPVPEPRMKTSMGPPPPKIPVTAATSEAGEAPSSTLAPHPQVSHNVAEKRVPMGPPPPGIPVLAEPRSSPSIAQTDKQENSQPVLADTNITNSGETVPEAANSAATDGVGAKLQKEDSIARSSIPYTIPTWSEPPGQPYFMEVLKDGIIIDHLDVSTKGAFMFGRIDICDFILEHPSISRFHAVLQFKGNGNAFLYDLGSTHGTFINKNQVHTAEMRKCVLVFKVKGKVYKDLHVGDVIRFGLSTRLYIFQGPSELMLPEGDLKRIKEAGIQRDEQDREASLLRARVEASLAEGISWGMAEDAIEEAAEDDADEVTWQSYKGQLTEKQEKTRDKIIKRSEKVANMRKEIDAIKAKEISQGGLTQGQQTQIARNEQRITQVLEELENLEETLNDSIRESIGAHARKLYGKKIGQFEDEDEVLSDDDEFYDRTKKKTGSLAKVGEKETVETAETLLDKKECITKEIEEMRNALEEEKKKITKEIEGETNGADALDAFMSGLSNQIEIDKAAQLEKKIHELEIDLERISYLLKIADPTGEAAKKRSANPPAANLEGIAISVSGPNKIHSKDEKKSHGLRKPAAISSAPETPVPPETGKPSEDKNTDEGEEKTPVYVLPKPRWLGATQEVNASDRPRQEVPLSTDEPSQFVDYKDRKTVLTVNNEEKVVTIEEAAPGLIIRKRKEAEKTGSGNAESLGVSTSSASAESNALDAVALLLKHQKGYLTSCDEVDCNDENASSGRTKSEKRKQKRKIGPEKPAFLDSNPDYESWVPPSGQTGDGRTSLNDRFGY